MICYSSATSEEVNPLSKDNNYSPSDNKNEQDITDTLKQDYRINKNISQKLSPDQREEILNLLRENDAVSDLVNALVLKNNELGNNNRQIGKKYTEEIKKQSAEIEKYQQKLQDLAIQKQQTLENLNQATRELEKINTEVKVAIARVKNQKSIWGKFSTMLEFLRTLFLDEEEINELLKTDYSDPEKPQMNTDIASIQKNLLDQ